MTILRGWYVAGRPDMRVEPWGSSEGWSRVVRNAIIWAGLADPADTRDDLAEEAHIDATILADLIAGWQELQGQTGRTAAEAWAEVRRDAPSILYGVAQRTGLRQGELLALRWDDVDLTAGVLTVRRAVTRGIVGTPKNGRTRNVDLSERARAALRDLPSRFRGELVFCADDGRMLTKGEAKRPLWRAFRKAGLRRIGWHVLRHTFASHLTMLGEPVKTIQELGGWRTLSMVMRYSHLSPDARRSSIARLDRSGERSGDDLAANR